MSCPVVGYVGHEVSRPMEGWVGYIVLCPMVGCVGHEVSYTTGGRGETKTLLILPSIL